MAKILLSVALMLLLTSLVTPVPASAQSQEDTRARQAQKVKARISKLGTGKQIKVNNHSLGYGLAFGAAVIGGVIIAVSLLLRGS